MSTATTPMVIVLMGVSSSGKSTIGLKLAELLRWPFRDADSFHPPANIAKMSRGIPLEDADRWPWLSRLNKELKQFEHAVLACSALKASYRERLAQGLKDFRIVYLHGARGLIHARMQSRSHFMPAALLESQFAALEPPADAIAIDVAAAPSACVAEIVARLQQKL